MFDLEKFRPCVGELTIVNPKDGKPAQDSEGRTFTIRLVGPDSPEYLRAQRQQANARLERQAQGQKVRAEDLEREDLELAVACTVGWSECTVGGTPLPFSAESAMRLYQEFPAIKVQVISFLGRRSNFLKG